MVSQPEQNHPVHEAPVARQAHESFERDLARATTRLEELREAILGALGGGAVPAQDRRAIATDILEQVERLIRDLVAAQERLQQRQDQLNEVLVRAVEQQQLNQSSEMRLRTLVEAAPAIIVTLAADGTIVQWNAGAQHVYGWSASEAIGQNFLTLCVPEEMRRFVQSEIEQAKQGLQVRRFETYARTHRGEHRILYCCCARLPSAPGQAPEIAMCCQDVTERMEVAHQRMLVREIEHRVKNNLATVLAIADQTIATVSSLAEFKRTFTGRISALAHMHTLLTQSKTQRVPLRRLIEQAVLPYVSERGPRALIDGPDLELLAKAAQCFCIALHELSTNAAKYGAFSVSTGRIEVKWEIESASDQASASSDTKGDEESGRSGPGPQDRDGPRAAAHAERPEVFRLTWTEFGGPAVREPVRRGFGIQLTHQCIEYELRGKVELQLPGPPPSGARCEITLPWNKDVGVVESPRRRRSPQWIGNAWPPADAPPSPDQQHSSHSESVEIAGDPVRDSEQLRGKRVLLVEDVHLVAAEIGRMVQRLGCELIGPAGTIENAMQYVQYEPIDVVLLDVNLHGQSTWTLADELIFRGVPFVFITGYACPASLPEVFRTQLYLEKPFDEQALGKKIGEALKSFESGVL